MPRLSVIRPKGKPNPYTSPKLNLLKAARFDRTVSDFENRVLAALTDHMNNHTGQTWPVADETIALEVGSKWKRSVTRARIGLRDKGYITWHRTRTSNVYGFNFAKAKTVLAMLTALKKNNSRGDSRRTPEVTLVSPIPVISSVKEESTKVEALSRERRLRVVNGGAA